MVEHKCEKEIKEIGKILKNAESARGLCYFSTHKSVLIKKARVQNFKWKGSVKTFTVPVPWYTILFQIYFLHW